MINSILTVALIALLIGYGADYIQQTIMPKTFHEERGKYFNKIQGRNLSPNELIASKLYKRSNVDAAFMRISNPSVKPPPAGSEAAAITAYLLALEAEKIESLIALDWIYAQVSVGSGCSSFGFLCNIFKVLLCYLERVKVVFYCNRWTCNFNLGFMGILKFFKQNSWPK